MEEQEKKQVYKSKHRYSTYSLYFILFFVCILSFVDALDSYEVDELCNVNNSFLFRYNDTWQCGNISDVVINYTVNNITNLYTNWSIHSDFWDLLDSPSDLLLSMFDVANWIDANIDMNGNWILGDEINFSHLYGNFGGNIDATGDPWTLSDVNFWVVNNITADTYFGDGSYLSGVGNTSSEIADVCRSYPTGNSTDEIEDAIEDSPYIIDKNILGIHNKSRLDSYCVGNWWFETNASDVSGNGGDLTWYNVDANSGNTTGIVGYGAKFNDKVAAPSYLATATPPDEWNTTNNATFAVWINKQGITVGALPYAFYNGFRDGFVMSDSGTQVLPQIYTYDGGHRRVNCPNACKFDRNEWHHVAIIVNDTDLGCWVDGDYCGDAGWTYDLSAGAKETAYVGAQGNIRGLNGTIDELLIFNRTLSSGEISQIYNEQKKGTNFESSISTQDIVPEKDNTYSLGSSVLRWLKGWFVDLDVKNNINASGNITADTFIINNRTTSCAGDCARGELDFNATGGCICVSDNIWKPFDFT